MDAPLLGPSKLPQVGTTIFTVISQLAAETGAINLGQGFPDFAVPEALVEAVARAMRDGKNQYAPMPGLPALREAISEATAAHRGYRPDPQTEVTVTAGASEAIADLVLATVGPGDEVIVLDPCYDLYVPVIELAGGIAVRIPLREPDFAIDWARVAAAVTSRTRLLVVNSPHNPTGAVWSLSDIEQLAALTRDTRILVCSDEVYEHIVYEGRHASVLSHPELRARSVVVSSFGKTYHCTGWRVGYAIAPAALTTELRKVHQYNTFAVFTPAQHAFAELLRAGRTHAAELGAFYRPKRDRFAAALAGTRFRPLPVPGGYFQLVDYAAVSDLPDLEFARWLCTTHGVAGIPLSPFYGAPPAGQRLLRLCFAKDAATLDAAVARLAEV